MFTLQLLSRHLIISKKYSCTNSKRFYLIQDFEAWYGIPDDDVYKTYGFGLCNIAISDWLTEKVRLSGHACHTVKNGFDFDKFRLENPIEHRSPFTVSMLYHVQERKGCKYGIEALERKKNLSSIKCNFIWDSSQTEFFTELDSLLSTT